MILYIKDINKFFLILIRKKLKYFSTNSSEFIFYRLSVFHKLLLFIIAADFKNF